jgi:hypothetical protein
VSLNIFALIGGVIGVFAVYAVINSLKQLGRLEQQASDERTKAIITKKQGEIMAQSRDSEDAADRLDTGSF